MTFWIEELRKRMNETEIPDVEAARVILKHTAEEAEKITHSAHMDHFRFPHDAETTLLIAKLFLTITDICKSIKKELRK